MSDRLAPAPHLDVCNPTLSAADVKGLAEFYRDKLGFRIEFVYGEPPRYSVVSRDGVRLSIALQDAQFGPVRVYAFVHNVDALYAQITAAGVKPERAPENQPYQMRDFDLTDPEGNRICFGEDAESQPHTHLRHIVAVLAVKDLLAALEFYRRHLGFAVGHSNDGYAVLKRDEVELHLARRPEAAGRSYCVIRVDNADLCFQQLTASGVTIRRPITNSRYGLRDFVITDPDGNEILIGQLI